MDQFEAVAEGIEDVAAANAWDAGVVSCFDAGVAEFCDQSIVVVTAQSRMGFFRGAEVFFDAEVDLDRAALEPASAAFSQFGRFGNFDHAEEIGVEGSALGLGVRRHGELHVVDGGEWELIPLRNRSVWRSRSRRHL